MAFVGWGGLDHDPKNQLDSRWKENEEQHGERFLGFVLRFQRARDVEHEPDAQEELSQHGSQLRDQVELHDLAQQRVVTGGVGLELSTWKKHTHTITTLNKKTLGEIWSCKREQHAPGHRWSSALWWERGAAGWSRPRGDFLTSAWGNTPRHRCTRCANTETTHRVTVNTDDLAPRCQNDHTSNKEPCERKDKS